MTTSLLNAIENAKESHDRETIQPDSFDGYEFVSHRDGGYTEATRVLHPTEVIDCVRLFFKRCPTEGVLLLSIPPAENPFLFLTEWQRANGRQVGINSWVFRRSIESKRQDKEGVRIVGSSNPSGPPDQPLFSFKIERHGGNGYWRTVDVIPPELVLRCKDDFFNDDSFRGGLDSGNHKFMVRIDPADKHDEASYVREGGMKESGDIWLFSHLRLSL